MSDAPSYRSFHKDFLWRVAGLPCELLEQFATDSLAAEVKGVVEVARHLAWAPWWRRHADGIGSVGLSDRFYKQFDVLRRSLADVMSEAAFQSAVAYSSPEAAVLLAHHEWIPARPRNSKQKRRELLAMRYLQRFVTKCETAATVGPTLTGRFTRVPDKVVYRFDPATYAPRMLVSHRVLTALADHFRRIPDILLKVAVRRHSGVAFRGASSVVHPTVGEITLNADSGTVLRTATEPVRVEDLRDAVACSTARLLQIVYALVQMRLLSDELTELHRRAHPLDQLREIVRRGSPSTASATSDLLGTIDEAMETWPVADSARKLALLEAIACAAQVCGVHLGDAGQPFYGDHLAVVEDGPCPGSRLEIDAEWAAPIMAELETAVRTSLEPDGTTRRDRRNAVAQRHAATSGQPTRVSVVELLARSDPGHVDTEPEDAGADDADPRHLVTSPDVMIVARDVDAVRSGEFCVVLAECHSAVGPAGYQSRVIDDPDEWLASISDFLTSRLAPHRPLMLTTVPTNKTWYTGPLSGVSYLEVGSPAPAGADTVALDDLEIGFSDRGPTLQTTARDTTFALLPDGRRAGDSQCPLEWLRPPRYTPIRRVGPRETTGRVVRKRAAWRLVSDGLPGNRADPLEVFVWAQRLRWQRDLPRWIFIHLDDERKPMCIDFSNPFLCEELLRHMRRSGSLHAEEMLPSPADAWVVGPTGHHLSELRLLYAAPS